MATELKLPELGESFDTGVVNAILVKAGDRVRKDQPVIEVETEKVTAEVPSTVEGVVREIRVEPGAEIKVGQVILVVDSEGSPDGSADMPTEKAPEVPEIRGGETEAPPPPATGPAREDREARARETGTARRPASAPVAPPQGPRQIGEEPETASPSPGAPAGPIRPEKPAAETAVPAAPAARRLARELGVDVRDIPGTEPGGRISLDDVKGYARRLIGGGAAQGGGEPALPDFSRWGSVRREPMSGVRRKTGERTALAWATIPHVTQHDEADITELESLRRKWSARAEADGIKLTVTAIVLKAAAVALKVFPRFNASVDVARREILLKDYISIGVAVDAPRGLLVPVIRDAGSKNILQIASEMAELSAKARARKLTLEEMEGASFTLSNLGSLGTTHFSPIVNWPEAAILGVGRASTRAVCLEGSFLPRQILPLSVSYDHRIVDGAEAARFLRWIAEALEQPLKMVLEG